jgi:hypothetical protein
VIDLFSLFVVVVIATSIWACVDAKDRDMINSFWLLVGCLLLWIVVFPVYLAERSKYPTKLVMPEQRQGVLGPDRLGKGADHESP